MAANPPGVDLDSTNSRQHRGQIATAVNSLLQRLFKPNPVAAATAAGDASATVSSIGNPVLLTGQINLAAGASTFQLKRGATVIATLGNLAAAKDMPIVFVDAAPGTGPFTYTTNGGGFTNSATLRAVELK